MRSLCHPISPNINHARGVQGRCQSHLGVVRSTHWQTRQDNIYAVLVELLYPGSQKAVRFGIEEHSFTRKPNGHALAARLSSKHWSIMSFIMVHCSLPGSLARLASRRLRPSYQILCCFLRKDMIFFHWHGLRLVTPCLTASAKGKARPRGRR